LFSTERLNLDHTSLGVGLERFIRVAIPKAIEREIKLAQDIVLEEMQANAEAEDDDEASDHAAVSGQEKKKKKKKKKSKATSAASTTTVDEADDDNDEDEKCTSLPSPSTFASSSSLPNRPATASSTLPSATNSQKASIPDSYTPSSSSSSSSANAKTKVNKSKNGKLATAVDDEEDLDALLAEMKIDPTHCQHRGCGKYIKLVGMNCPYCHVRIH
jgi:glucan-binding YG repeat protein